MKPKTAPRHMAQTAAVAALIAAVVLPWTVDAYTISLASYALVSALLAMSTHLMTGFAGLPSLGQAAFLGVGAYTAARCAQHWTTLGPLQLIAAIAVAAMAAAVAGLAVSGTRGIYFLLATLGVGELAHAIAQHWTAVTGAGNGLNTPAITPWPGGPALSNDGHVYLYVLTVFVTLAVGTWLLLRSRFGLVVRAIADHEPRMAANGYHGTAWIWAVYVIAGGIAGAAGALLVATRRYISPTDLAFDVSAIALIAAIIGGTRIATAALAAVGIVVLRDFAGNLLVGYSPLLLGALFIVVAVTLSPPHGNTLRCWLRLQPTRQP